MRYQRLIIRTPISFAGQGHVQEFEEPIDRIGWVEGCPFIYVIRGEEEAHIPWSGVVAAYGACADSMAGFNAMTPGWSLTLEKTALKSIYEVNAVPRPITLETMRDRIENATKPFEQAVVDEAVKRVQNKLEEAPNAAEEGKQQEDQGREYPKGNRRR